MTPLPVFRALFAVCLLLVFGTGQAAAQIDDPVARYRACPVVGPSPARLGERSVWVDNAFWTPPLPVPDSALQEDDAWTPAPSVFASHLALRERLGERMPSGETQVLLFEDWDHHGHIRYESLVATRDAQGRWMVDEVQEGFPGTPDARVAYARWNLTESDGRALDDLLADPCLEAEPSRSRYSSYEMSVEQRWTLEIVQGDRSLAFQREFGGFGRVAGFIHILNRGHP